MIPLRVRISLTSSFRSVYNVDLPSNLFFLWCVFEWDLSTDGSPPLGKLQFTVSVYLFVFVFTQLNIFKHVAVLGFGAIAERGQRRSTS